MPLAIDWGNQIIQITSPTVSVDGQVLHDFVEDESASPEGMLYDDILQPEGKIEDPTNPGVFSQIIMVLNSPWQIQFWAGSGYTRIFGAKIVGGLSDQPMKATGNAGDITVLESPVDGLTVVSGSGVTAQDKTDIMTLIMQELCSNHTHVSGSLADAVWDARTHAINAAMLEQSAPTMILDSVASGIVETTTQFKGGGTATLSAENDNYLRRIVIFKSGTIQDQVTRITAYDATTKVFTVVETTSPPADGDTFIIV